MKNKEIKKPVKTLNWRKIGGRMARYLCDWMDSQPVEPVTTVWITTKPNPSRYALTILKALGVNTSKPAIGLFTGHLSPPQIVALTERRFIVSVEKSSKSKSC